jgi:hypothetical protein
VYQELKYVAALVAKPLDIGRFRSIVVEALAQATDLPPREGMSVFVLGWPPA